jgi:hypothetical protein
VTRFSGVLKPATRLRLAVDNQLGWGDGGPLRGPRWGATGGGGPRPVGGAQSAHPLGRELGGRMVASDQGCTHPRAQRFCSQWVL